MRIAVLGAGLSGSLAALELSEAGCDVDLYDRCAAPVIGASLHNEGKIHLGFVYAKDRSRATARTMIRGALAFRPLLSRWIDSATLDGAVSDPFIYALHRDSMMDDASVVSHFEDIEAIYSELARRGNSRYIAPSDQPLWRRRPAHRHDDLFDGELVTASFDTAERSIDTEVIAAAVGGALRSGRALHLFMGTEILGVEESDGDKLTVRCRRDDVVDAAAYDVVINALWQNRLAIDQTLGLAVDRPVMHRYKVGLFSRRGESIPGCPTVTFLVGSFGDSVACPEHTYINWYPSGLIKEERSLCPSPPRLDERRRSRIIAETVDAMARLMPGAAQHLCRGPGDESWDVRGGFISAWGRSGIDDPDSELHNRYAIGVSTHGNYHSIDTGKYTTAPLFAHEACSRVLRGARLEE